MFREICLFAGEYITMEGKGEAVFGVDDCPYESWSNKHRHQQGHWKTRV